MKLAILYRTTPGPWGGGNSFLRSLAVAWRAMGIEVSPTLREDLDGVLINSANLGSTKGGRMIAPHLMQRLVQNGYVNALPAHLGRSRWRRAGTRPPFVHRLDGIFRLYGRPDSPEDRAQVLINPYMDWTIYQSRFCQDSFVAEGIDVTRSTIIWNGVDITRFYPASQLPPTRPFRLVCVAWSPNLRKGAPYAVQASQMPGVEVTFIGQWPAGLEPGAVRVISPVSHQELPSLIREHHAMLHMAQNDPCSNAILESMASGLPVIYHPSGGSPEIIGDCGISGEPDLRQAIVQVQDSHDEFRARVLARQPELSIDRVALRYRDIFQNLKRVAL